VNTLQIKESNSTPFLLLSVLVHLALVAGLESSFFTQRNYSDKTEQQSEIVLHIETLKEDPKITPPLKSEIVSTYVSPSDIQESKIIPETHQLSDKNTIVDREMIKRGIEVEQKIKPKLEPTKKSPALPTKEIKTPNKNQENSEQSSKGSIKNLFLNKNTTFQPSTQMEGSDNGKQVDNKLNNSATDPAQKRLQEYIGAPGNSDFAPHLPDGDLTLLNAKADRFAVFVRRVALQVFASLRTSDWAESATFQRGVQTDEVTIIAKLDPSGKFLNAQIVAPSSYPAFDKTVYRSVVKGAWDKNPPSAALAKDGTITLIFKSKAWVRRGPQGRMSRWILLGTGLE